MTSTATSIQLPDLIEVLLAPTDPKANWFFGLTAKGLLYALGEIDSQSPVLATQQLTERGEKLHKAVVSNDGHLVAATVGDRMFLWRYDNEPHPRFELIAKRADACTSSGPVCFSQDGRKIYSQRGYGIDAWSVPDLEHLNDFYEALNPEPNRYPLLLCTLPEGGFLYARDRVVGQKKATELMIHNEAEREDELLYSFASAVEYVSAVSCPDSSLIALCVIDAPECHLYMLDLKKKEQEVSWGVDLMTTFGTDGFHIRPSRDGAKLALFRHSGSVEVVDLKQHTFFSVPARPSDVAWNSDAKMLVVDHFDAKIEVVDPPADVDKQSA
jgi:hypothetical protein